MTAPIPPVPVDYLVAAGTFRFFVEFVRGNEVQALGLTGPQIVLIPLLALLAAHFLRQRRVGAWRLPPAPAPVRPDLVAGGVP